jgi:hypothetical protein
VIVKENLYRWSNWTILRKTTTSRRKTRAPSTSASHRAERGSVVR